MVEEINTVTARKLRVAMQKLDGKQHDEDAVPEEYVGDQVMIQSSFEQTGKKDFYLCIMKEGRVCASVKVNRSVLKKLKGEMNCWADLQSGLASSYRKHGGGQIVRY